MFRSTFCVGRPFFRFGRSDETFLFGKRIIFIENFAGTNFHSIFAVPKRRFRRRHAEIAQLVERNLAKVEVAGPSPVFRSNNKGRTSPVLPFVVDAGHARGLSARPQGALFRGRGCRQRIAAVTRAKRECESRFPLQRGKSGKRKENRKILLFVFRGGGTGFDARDLKAPLSGAGGVNNESRPSLALCASLVFRFRKKGRILRLFPFCFVCMVQGLVPFPGFGCRFRQGVADCIADRPATYRKKCSVL